MMGQQHRKRYTNTIYKVGALNNFSLYFTYVRKEYPKHLNINSLSVLLKERDLNTFQCIPLPLNNSEYSRSGNDVLPSK